MKVLLIGSGGREHAIAWKIAQSSKLEKLYVAPANAGIGSIAEVVDIAINQHDELLDFARDKNIDLVVVGPEDPLVEGIADKFIKAGIKVIGANQNSAMLEGSKAFAKDFMMKHDIPTAEYREFSDVNEAKKNIEMFGFPVVIKADGLAAGKGVIIAENKDDAIISLNEIMVDKKFKGAGDKIVLERFLKGIEASVLCFVDDETIVPMESAQDYKRAMDGDMGLNTGGMGTYSPSRLFNDDVKRKIQTRILEPFHNGLKKDGLLYKGIIFIGIMIDGDDIRVIEFNVRFGDPETQSIMVRLDTDILDIFNAMSENRLSNIDIKWKDNHAVCVMLASGGYPEAYEKGKEINGITDDMLIFHSGTKIEDGKLYTNGGRVLGVMGIGERLDIARKNAYKNVDKISFDKMHFRNDIGKLIQK